MGKLQDVLSRRILWFKKQRLFTAAAAAAAIAVVMSCNDTVMEPRSDGFTSNAVAGDVTSQVADSETVDFNSVAWEYRVNGNTHRYYPTSSPDSRITDVHVWIRNPGDESGTGKLAVDSGDDLADATFLAVGKSWTLSAHPSRNNRYNADVTAADLPVFGTYSPVCDDLPVPRGLSATLTDPRVSTELAWEAAEGCHTGYNIQLSNTLAFSDQKTEYQRNQPSQKSVVINHSLNGGWSAEASTLYYRVLSTQRGSSNPPRSAWSEVLAVDFPSACPEGADCIDVGEERVYNVADIIGANPGGGATLSGGDASIASAVASTHRNEDDNYTVTVTGVGAGTTSWRVSAYTPSAWPPVSEGTIEITVLGATATPPPVAPDTTEVSHSVQLEMHDPLKVMNSDISSDLTGPLKLKSVSGTTAGLLTSEDEDSGPPHYVKVIPTNRKAGVTTFTLLGGTESAPIRAVLTAMVVTDTTYLTHPVEFPIGETRTVLYSALSDDISGALTVTETRGNARVTAGQDGVSITAITPGRTTAILDGRDILENDPVRVTLQINVTAAPCTVDVTCIQIETGEVRRLTNAQLHDDLVTGAAVTAASANSGDDAIVTWAAYAERRVAYLAFTGVSEGITTHLFTGRDLNFDDVSFSVQVTVLPGSNSTHIRTLLDGGTYEATEGDTVSITVSLDVAATSETVIPVTITAPAVTGTVAQQAYDWTANAAAADYSIIGGDAEVTIAAGATSGVIRLVITDDALIEPPQEETLTVGVSSPLVMNASQITIQLQEGICDRDHRVQRAINQAVNRLNAPASQCHLWTTSLVRSARWLLLNGSDVAASGDPASLPVKLGDFAGLVDVVRLQIARYDLSAAELDRSIFADLDALGEFWFKETPIDSLPARMFSGVNPDLPFLSLNVTHPGGAGGRGLHLDADLFEGLDNLRHLEVMGTLTQTFPDGLFADLSNLENLLLVDNYNLQALTSAIIGTPMPNLRNLSINNSPSIGNSLPADLLSNFSSLRGLYLEKLRLENGFNVGELFSSTTVPSIEVLSLRDNLFTSLNGVVPVSKFPNLRSLNFSGNRVETLSSDAFNGLTLNVLRLDGNPGAPFESGLELVVNADTTELRVVIAYNTPTPINFTVYGANFAETGTVLSIPVGSKETEWMPLTRTDLTSAVMVRVFVDSNWSRGIQGIESLEEAEVGLVLYGTGTNTLPILTKAFYDVHMLNGTTLENNALDLTPFVKSVSGESITFSVSSADPTIVVPSLEGASLTLEPQSAGTARIEVTGTADGVGLTTYFEAVVDEYDAVGYNIKVAKIGAAQMEPLSSAIDAAVEHWEGLLKDLPVEVGGFGLEGDEGEPYRCSFIQLPFHVQHIDDLVLIIAAPEIDGPGGTLAAATICYDRNDEINGVPWGDAKQLSTMGLFYVDEADISYLADQPAGLTDVFIHEIGHILGLGITWHYKAPADGMTFDPDDRSGMLSQWPFVGARGAPKPALIGKDLAFLGTNAYAAWDSVGGTNTSFSLKGTPIATEGGAGSFGGHWSEKYLLNEIMTPFYNEGTNPFSNITKQAMEDLGFDIDESFSVDDYSLPSAGLASSLAADGSRTLFDLSNDILPMEVRSLHPNSSEVRRAGPMTAEALELEEAIRRGMEAITRLMTEEHNQRLGRVVMKLDDRFDR